MDKISIESKFMTYVISKALNRIVRKKTGRNIDICLNGVRAVFVDDKVRVHLDVDAEIGKDDFSHLIDGD